MYTQVVTDVDMDCPSLCHPSAVSGSRGRLPQAAQIHSRARQSEWTLPLGRGASHVRPLTGNRLGSGRVAGSEQVRAARESSAFRTSINWATAGILESPGVKWIGISTT